MTSTPKPHWSNVDLLGLIAKEFNIPFYFTTDVNSSAYGETLVRKGVKSLVYYTIGTGIGAGAIQNGEFIGGMGHTEAGHVYVPLHPNDVSNEFNGTCHSTADVWKVWLLVHHLKPVQVFVAN